MPKTILQCKKIKEDRINSIIKESTLIFASKHYLSVSVDDITSTCKCSHGLFYHYFRNKEHIFEIVLKNSIELFFSKFDISYAESLKPLEGLTYLLEVILNMFKEEDPYLTSALYLILNLRLQKDELPKPKLQCKNPKKLNEIIFSFIQKGQEDGSMIQGDTREYTVSIMAILKGLAYNRLYIGNKRFLCPRKETILNLVVNKL